MHDYRKNRNDGMPLTLLQITRITAAAAHGIKDAMNGTASPDKETFDTLAESIAYESGRMHGYTLGMSMKNLSD